MVIVTMDFDRWYWLSIQLGKFAEKKAHKVWSYLRDKIRREGVGDLKYAISLEFSKAEHARLMEVTRDVIVNTKWVSEECLASSVYNSLVDAYNEYA